MTSGAKFIAVEDEEFKQAQADGFTHMEHRYFETVEKDHGRIEKRQCWYTHDIEGIGTLERWPYLAGMAMCRATRTVNGETSVEDRYFITSCTHNDVQKIAAAIRAHWRVENSLHWILDIAFNEDQSRIRVGYAAENLALRQQVPFGPTEPIRYNYANYAAKPSATSEYSTPVMRPPSRTPAPRTANPMVSAMLVVWAARFMMPWPVWAAGPRSQRGTW